MSPARIRVVYLVSTLRQAGPTTQLLNIVRHLDRARFDPVVVTLSAEPRASLREAFVRNGVETRSFAFSRIKGALHTGWRRDLERVVGSPLDRSCIIHSQGIRADTISARHLRDLPRIATARNYPYDDYLMKFGAVLGRWMARTHLRALRDIPVIVACSATLGRKLQPHDVATTVIRNGVELSSFTMPSAAERLELRTRLRLSADARVAVWVGSLVVRKDPATALRAMKAAQDSSLVMLVVGAGEMAAACRREAGSDARIRFVGHADDVAPYLRAADFFVSSSRSEGMPNAVLEALSCGLYLLLSDIEPHRELLALAPGAGELLPLADVNAFTSGLLNAAVRAADGAAERSLAAHALGAEQVSKLYQELYVQTVGGARNR